MDFWDHLEELRGSLVKAVVAVALCAVAAFVCKQWLFAVVMAPSHNDFVTYRLLQRISGHSADFHVDLFNPDLAGQFVVHMKMALWMGFLVVSPYLLFLLFRFVSPGLYPHERRYAVRAVAGGYLMFLMGVSLNYFLIFPFAFRFLGTYQVGPEVPNQIALTSYVGMLLLLCLMMGILFELPVLCWLLAKMGLLHAAIMSHYRRHAVVVILIVSAIVTPTGDPFTLSLVALPVYLLYEASILIVKRNEKVIESDV